MRLFIILLLFGITSTLFAQSTEDKAQHINSENGVAIQGYDPVAYFSNKALEGKEQYSANHSGVTYYFSSEENKTAFLQNPSKYEPQYGGWCAFAIGDYGEKVKINPETFKVVDDKLYLFYNANFTNTLKSWNKNEKELKAQANKNWSQIVNEK